MLTGLARIPQRGAQESRMDSSFVGHGFQLLVLNSHLHRPRATGFRLSTEVSSRGSVHPLVGLRSAGVGPGETHPENDRAFIGSRHPNITFNWLFGRADDVLIPVIAPHNRS